MECYQIVITKTKFDPSKIISKAIDIALIIAPQNQHLGLVPTKSPELEPKRPPELESKKQSELGQNRQLSQGQQVRARKPKKYQKKKWGFK